MSSKSMSASDSDLNPDFRTRIETPTPEFLFSSGLTPRIPRGLFTDTSEHISVFYFLVFLFSPLFSCCFVLQCFDAVGWVAGRASGL